MDTKVTAPVGAVPIRDPDEQPRRQASAAETPSSPFAATTPHRLIIEEGPRKGTFVYKTIDRDTGEVVRQLPREEVVRLSRDSATVPGQVASLVV